MALEFTEDPVSVDPHVNSVQQSGEYTVYGSKSLGGGDSRNIRVTIATSWEGEDPEESEILQRVEDLWDLMDSGWGLTINSASTPGPSVEFGIQKATP